MSQKKTANMPSAPRIKRREVLSFLSSAAAVSLLGCQREPSGSTSAKSSAQTVENTTTQQIAAVDVPNCVASPRQTEGPYFVEEGLNRSDIRSDPADGSVKAGVPLRLVLRVSQVSGGACIPIEGAIVDIWHCDAEGVYSDASDRTFSTVGQKSLRGSQVTNSDGTVEFVTIYPGQYPGRAVHIHFKVRNSTDPQGYEFTSQLYFDDAVTDQVYARAPYRLRGQRDMRNERDRIYQSGGEQLTLQLVPDEVGYTGNFNIGLQMA